jgi:hypothetical protein
VLLDVSHGGELYSATVHRCSRKSSFGGMRNSASKRMKRMAFCQPRIVDRISFPTSGWFKKRDQVKEFLQFIRNDLVPYIERTYNVSQDRAWFGYSFGGLFGTYALFNDDGLFGRFTIGSPSLWRASQTIKGAEQSFAAAGKPISAKVFFSVGLLEPGGMVGDLRVFIGTLEQRHYKDLEYQVHYFEDETHLSVIPVTISKGLRYIYAPPSSKAAGNSRGRRIQLSSQFPI